MSKIDVLIPEDKVRARIKEMAAEISAKYKGSEVVCIGILNGSVFFLTALLHEMTIPTEIDFMAASSYVGTNSTGKVLITKDLERSIEGKHVIIVEDIVDTGQTLHLLKELLSGRNPKSLEIATLLDKPERRISELNADYVGFEIPNEFVIGWGMDYNQKYRDLAYIGIFRGDTP